MLLNDVPDCVAAALGIDAHTTISPAPQGMTSDVAFVETPGSTAVLKRCRNPLYIEWLRRERQVLDAISDITIRIPRPVAYYEHVADGRVVDVWLLMTRVRGEPLWPVMLRASHDERIAQLRAVGALLRVLHATAVPDRFRGQPPWIDRMLRQARANLPWCDGTPVLLDALEHSQPSPHAETLVHGDFALDNVLVDEDGSLGLIDWSGGDSGDPRHDVALALANEPELMHDTRELDAFFEGYGSPAVDAAVRRWFVDLYDFF